MDSATTAAVAFGSALLGAMAAFAGQKYLADRDFRRRRMGLLRALIGELMQNGAAVTASMYTGAEVVQYSTKTWDSLRVELGQFLRPNLYEDVDFV